MPTVIATITTPDCTCCSPCVTGTLSCRTRSGTATLCGFSEFTSPSSPPKKYRTLTTSGTLHAVCLSTILGCSGGVTYFQDTTLSGSCRYDATTCAYSSDATQTFNDNGSVTVSGNFFCQVLRDGVGLSGTTTRTTVAVNADGFCYGSGGGNCGDGGHQKTTGSLLGVLSDEDTEADAITRLLAGSGGTWSSWSAGSSTTCRARYEHRTTGFSFVYQEAQWRITASGLTPGASYVVPVDFYRSVFGAGSYTLYQSITAMGTADGSGNLDIEGDVPNDAGYDTYAQQGTCPS